VPAKKTSTSAKAGQSPDKGPDKGPDKARAKAKAGPSAGGGAIALLKADHADVDALFDQFEQADPRDKAALANAICIALKVHARIEEDLFYPAALAATGETALLLEAQVEHAAARDLIAQIETGHPGTPLFDARVMVLGEYVRHHVDEEEGELFPLFAKAGGDDAELGRLMALRKQELLLGVTVSNPVLALS